MSFLPRRSTSLDFVLGRETQFDFYHHARRIGFDGRVLIVTARLSEAEGAELIRWERPEFSGSTIRPLRPTGYPGSGEWTEGRSEVFETIFEISAGKEDIILCLRPRHYRHFMESRGCYGCTGSILSYGEPRHNTLAKGVRRRRTRRMHSLHDHITTLEAQNKTPLILTRSFLASSKFHIQETTL